MSQISIICVEGQADKSVLAACCNNSLPPNITIPLS